ncbi:hypothetical protein SETIT_5G110800v2 [Setaria italica]|uniref:Uncharacterized protein n=1 Tax=Setaria italica TaxID=4555 RepID=K3XRZ8_SETIT|nr:hypothetical protein SETIT_5G110800v2 [Setaria italica]
MAAERPWKAHVLGGVVSVGNLCVNARDKLIYASPRCDEAPMRVANAQDARRRIHLLRDFLTDASGDLARAMGDMVAAEILSLQAAAADPRTPLVDVQDIPDGDGDLRQALDTLRRARVSAERAYNYVQRCRGRLFTAALLLQFPDLPDVDDFIAVEQANAASSCEGATHLAADCTALITEACRFLGRF